MDYGETLFSQPLMPTELQDLLMCESYFDDYTNSSLMDHDNTTHTTTTSSNSDNTDSNSNSNNISTLAQRLDATTATTLSQAQQIAQLQAQLQALTSGFINFNSWEFDNSSAKSNDIDSSVYGSPELLANVNSPDSQPSILSNSSFTSPSESSLSPPYSSPSPLDSLLPDFNMASTPPHGYPNLLIPSLKEELDQDHDELRRKAAIAANVTNIEQQLNFMQQQVLSPLPESDNANQGFQDRSIVASKKRRTTSDDVISPRKIANVPSRPSKRESKSEEMPMLRGETLSGQTTSTAAINIPVQFPSVNLAATPTFNFGQPVFPNLLNSDLGNKVPIQRLKPPAGTPVPHPPPGKQVKQKKVAHNAIERRYRNNINDRIADLKNVVPALYHAKLKDPKDKGNKRPAKDDDEEDEGDDSAEIYDGVAAATKLNKATILRKATEYIVYLKKSNEHFKEENSVLRALLAQFPGGLQLLEEYQLQESARELQQLKKENSPSTNESDEDGVFADSNNTPGSRVMMMLFMAVSFMGTSPMTSWNNGSPHHHEGKALGGNVTPGTNSSDEPNFTVTDGISDRLNNIFGGIQFWTLIRMVILVFLAYFYLPLWFGRRRRFGKVGQGKLYKQSKTDTKVTSNNRYAIYRDLVASLPNPPPHGKYSLRLGIFTEASQFILRHMLGFNFWSHSSINGVDEEKLIRIWMRLGEIECLGGNPRPSCESLLYTCLKTLNVAESLEDESIFSSPSRIYANAAIQVTLALPNHPIIAGRLSRYFWSLAMHSAKTNSDDESAEWIESLLLDVHEDDHEEQVSGMIDSKVWNDALYVIKKRFVGDISERRGRKGRKGPGAGSQVSLNSTKSIIPMEILSDFQSLHNLYTVFQHLITLITSAPAPSTLTDDTSYSESTFDLIYSNTTCGTVAHWYAVCGAAVESFWKNDVKTAETLVLQLKNLPKLPAADRNDERAWDDATKQMIAYTLIGVALVKRGRIVEGTRVLEKGRKIGGERRRITESQEDRSLESSVRVLAEFVAGVCGLEAWISIWRIVVSKGSQTVAPAPMFAARLKPEEERDILASAEEQQLISKSSSISDIDLPAIYIIIISEINSLRRKMETEPLNKLDDMEDLLARLCTLKDMISEMEQFDIDPGYESVSDGEEVRNRTKQAAVNAGEKALQILKGYK